MGSENFTWAGNTLAQGALAARQGSSDPALEVVEPSHLLSLSHDTKSVVSKPKSTTRSHHFYQDEQISRMVDQWRNSPDEFLGDLPTECNVAYCIYEKIGRSSLIEMCPVDVVRRRVYMVHYYRLRKAFGHIFISLGNTHSLSLFLQHFMLQSVQEHGLFKEQDLFKKNLAAYGTGGKSSTQIESRGYSLDIPAATAIESIAHLGEMGKYDEAAEKIYDVLEGWWTSWLNSIKPTSSSRMPVLSLFSNEEIAEFIRPPRSCHSQTGRLLSTSTASSTALERTGPIQETAFTAPEAIVTAEDIDGIDRQFNLRNLQQVFVLVQDISGHWRYVQVRTLTDVLSNHAARMQLQPPHIVFPAMAMPSEGTFPSNIFINQENLW
ncbi:hypothetical protein MRS44_013478 [Fusarium solani]|uniref:uncharacterized protein n=1 Tax=Fusarium solani TaxID=169388 RepID=UPI0032C3E5BE|nr:hypothetical protein MRS44_013478 [Fusarium solani]